MLTAEKAASEPDFQNQIVNRLEAIGDGATKIVDVAFRHRDRPQFSLSGSVLSCRRLEMSFHSPRRVTEEESVDHVVAGIADGVEKDARQRALLPNPAIVFLAQFLLEEIDEERNEGDVAHAGDHQFADVLAPPCCDPDQGSEFSFERIPGEVDESDAGEMLVVETCPLPSRQWRVFEHLTHL